MQENKLHLTYSCNDELLKRSINDFKEIEQDCYFDERQIRIANSMNGLNLEDEYAYNKTNEQDKETNTEENEFIVPLDKRMCEIHDNCELTHFCRKCEIPICQLCRPSLKHKGHRTKRIGIAVAERKEQLFNIIQARNDKNKDLHRNLTCVETEKVNVRSSCDEVVARIRQRCVYMKTVLDNISNNLVKEIYYRKKNCLQQYTHTQKEIQSELKNNECSLDFMNLLSETQDEIEFLKGYNEIKENTSSEKKIPLIWKEYVNFDQGQLSAKELKEKFGSVSFIVAADGRAFTYENKKQYGRLSCRTKRSFRCERRNTTESEDDEQDGGPINTITKSRNQIWVSCGLSSKQISLVNEDGKTIKSLRLKFKVEDMTYSDDGALIVSVFHDKAIRKIFSNGDNFDIINVPYHPKGIHLTKDGGYLICMCDSYSTSVCDDSRRIVAKYTDKGIKERVYEYDGDTKLFTRPFRVAENTNGDICVIDKTSMGSGQVVILDKSGVLKAVYNGTNQPMTGNIQKIISRFAPSDIACDQNDRIFIAEADNHKIHLLSKDGRYIGHFLTSESDFFCPQCITTDGSNQIWIGNEYGEIKMFTCDWQ